MANTSMGAKPRKEKKLKNGRESWAAAFDKDELKMLKDLQGATGGILSISEIQRAAVRYAVPLFLAGKAPITERITLTAPPSVGS